MVHRSKTGWSYKPTNIRGVSHLMSCATKFVVSGPVHVYPHEIWGRVRYPILSFHISSFIYTLTFQSAWETSTFEQTACFTLP